MKLEEKCVCGKRLKHKGRCTGHRIIRKKPIPNAARAGKYDELLAEIEDRITQLQATKAAIRSLITRGIL